MQVGIILMGAPCGQSYAKTDTHLYERRKGRRRFKTASAVVQVRYTMQVCQKKVKKQAKT